ncbi:hypothetical protein ACJX0J_029310 [Zea mays]
MILKRIILSLIISIKKLSNVYFFRNHIMKKYASNYSLDPPYVGTCANCHLLELNLIGLIATIKLVWEPHFLKGFLFSQGKKMDFQRKFLIPWEKITILVFCL